MVRWKRWQWWEWWRVGSDGKSWAWPACGDLIFEDRSVSWPYPTSFKGKLGDDSKLVDLSEPFLTSMYSLTKSRSSFGISEFVSLTTVSQRSSQDRWNGPTWNTPTSSGCNLWVVWGLGLGGRPKNDDILSWERWPSTTSKIFLPEAFQPVAWGINDSSNQLF